MDTLAEPTTALEPHGERRRQQLIRAASWIIESEGVDAMRMPRVAEVAGCARSLVYHYFRSRDDLFVAVIESFYERLGDKMDLGEQAAGMRALLDPDSPHPLLEALWDSVMEVGAGGLVLRTSPRIGTDLDRRLEDLAAAFDLRWIEPLIEIGLSELEATLVLKTATTVHAELLDRHRRGEVTRTEALALGRRALSSLVVGLRRDVDAPVTESKRAGSAEPESGAARPTGD